FRYLAANAPAFEDLVAASWTVRVDEGGGEQPRVQFVSSNYFGVLGAGPSSGLVLSHAFWQRRFGGEPTVGRTITLNGASFPIAGVAPPPFAGTGNLAVVPDLWAPLDEELAILGRRRGTFAEPPLQILGHVRRETTMAEASAQVDALVAPMASAFRSERQTTALTIERATWFGLTNDPRFRAFVAVVMSVVSLVLLIACANLANMLLARATGRQKEIGVRLALGASRSRIGRQLLTESPLLSALGGRRGSWWPFWRWRFSWCA